VTNIVLLDRHDHADLRVRTDASASWGDGQRFVQVVVRELPFLAVHYPVLFSKDSETGAFFCGAMLGFDPGENLFLGDRGEGQDTYRPLNLQRGPFYTADANLAIDLDNPRVSRTEGQPLFSETGEPTPYLESIAGLFRELRPGLEMTKAFIEALNALSLIEPIDINLSFDDGAERELQGLYTINQDALRNLADEHVVALFRRGYLQLAYLMIASLKQIPVLARRKNSRLLDGSEALVGTLG